MKCWPQTLGSSLKNGRGTEEYLCVHFWMSYWLDRRNFGKYPQSARAKSISKHRRKHLVLRPAKPPSLASRWCRKAEGETKTIHCLKQTFKFSNSVRFIGNLQREYRVLYIYTQNPLVLISYVSMALLSQLMTQYRHVILLTNINSDLLSSRLMFFFCARSPHPR